MRKSIHSESEIVKSVRELESGVPADQICRRLNISVSTLYQWRKKYSGLDASQLKCSLPHCNAEIHSNQRGDRRDRRPSIYTWLGQNNQVHLGIQFCIPIPF